MCLVSNHDVWQQFSQAYGRNSTKAEIRIYSSGGGINPSAGGRNPPPPKSIELETVVTDQGQTRSPGELE